MMMKKLLALMLVLGITSIASAGVIDLDIVSLNGEPIPAVKEITIMESDWVDIDIMYSTDIEGQRLAQAFVEITLTGTATMSVDELTFPEGTWDFDPTWTPGITVVVAGKQYLLQYSEGMVAGGGVHYPGGIAIDHILVHCDSASEVPVLITLADAPVVGTGSMELDPFGIPGMGLSYGPGVTINQIPIPEPMTIALLGLGSLALLRRRK